MLVHACTQQYVVGDVRLKMVVRVPLYTASSLVGVWSTEHRTYNLKIIFSSVQMEPCVKMGGMFGKFESQQY
jgi:hypothetical protein